MTFRNGIYKVVYEGGTSEEPGAHALVIVRDGAFLGSDPNGAIFSGAASRDATGGGSASGNLTVPPYSALITGFATGNSWANVSITCALDPDKTTQHAVAEVDGAALPITLCNMGPLPD